ncbi:unnamed protein product [Rhizoctonia solani]|uniref:Chitin-binding type-2 domain-containing protein n=1 Tax=Rhizoctonia solani TaxID=456999 RepID=A0A8H3H515_9AGAM|nr:unnamed protein product [Rhizoctonia solani]
MLGLEAFVIVATYTSVILAVPTRTDGNLQNLGICPAGDWYWRRLNVCLPLVAFEENMYPVVNPPEPFECPKGWYWYQYPRGFRHCNPANINVLYNECPDGYSWKEELIACIRMPQSLDLFPLRDGVRGN